MVDVAVGVHERRDGLVASTPAGAPRTPSPVAGPLASKRDEPVVGAKQRRTWRERLDDGELVGRPRDSSWVIRLCGSSATPESMIRALSASRSAMAADRYAGGRLTRRGHRHAAGDPQGGAHDTTDTTTPTAVETTVDTYLATWNETDPAKRAPLIEASLGADLWYRDPMLEADGLEAYDGMIAAVQGQFPGLVMRRTSPSTPTTTSCASTGRSARRAPSPVFAGLDVAKYDADGKLHRIIGFAGEPIAAAGSRLVAPSAAAAGATVT